MDGNPTYQASSLLRLSEVLRRFPVSKSSWWAGIKDQRYPAPVKIGKRAIAWLEADIDELISQCHSVSRSS